MPAKGWKKTNAKSQVIKLRVEPEFADRVVAEAGEGNSSVSHAVRTAAAVGLDAIERRRLGLEPSGKLRVELTGAEEAVREQQRRYAEAAMRKRRAKDVNARELGERIVAKLRERPCPFTELMYGTAKRPDRNNLRAALNMLNAEGRIRTISVGSAETNSRVSLFALVVEDSRPPAAVPRPAVRRVMDEVLSVTHGSRVFTLRGVAQRVVVPLSTVSEAVAALLAEGTLRRIGKGVFEIVERDESAVHAGADPDEGRDGESASEVLPAARRTGFDHRRGWQRRWTTPVQPSRLVHQAPTSSVSPTSRRPSLFDRAMTEGQFAVFRVLVERKETTIGELAEATGQKYGTVARTLRLFVKGALARRIGSKDSGPGRHVVWTPGRLAAARMREVESL